ncbi:hypothetical protein NVIRPANT_00999 [Pantoea sp. Nvir]|nr:hypothetical protein NVIRPANT_00999 [Pantoea sp. Nvir]
MRHEDINHSYYAEKVISRLRTVLNIAGEEPSHLVMSRGSDFLYYDELQCDRLFY